MAAKFDNAPAHYTLSYMGQFLTKNGMTTVLHPHYLLNLGLSDLFLLPQMKRKCFTNVAEVKKKTTNILSSITLDELKKYF